MYECFLEYEVVVLFKSCIYRDERKSICDYFFPVLFGRVGVRGYLVLGGFLYSHYLRKNGDYYLTKKPSERTAEIMGV